MGMSMHCYAVKPADAEYRRKADAYHACIAAKVTPPQELVAFFNDEPPDPSGVTFHLGGFHSLPSALHQALVTYQNGEREGFEVDIEKLPPGTRFVRFVCSW